MAQIISQLRTNIYDYLVSYYESKKIFKNELLAIKIEEYEYKRDQKIKKTELRFRHHLSKYEIQAGIQSDYIEEIVNENKKDIEDKYDLKQKIIEQKIKRAKNPSKKAALKEKLRLISEQKATAIQMNQKKYIIDEPTKEAIQLYNQFLEISEEKKNRTIETIKTTYDEKIKAIQMKTEKDLKKYTAKIETYSKKLIEIEESLKTKKNAVVLDKEIALSLRNLSMHFGGLKAVDELSFDVKKGEIFGLIGPNGAGKTTVFNCITRFYKPTYGDMYFRNANQKTIHLNNVAVHNIIKEGIARTFQNVELVWELNILDNLLVAAHSVYRSNFFGHTVHSRLTKREETIFTKKAMKILNDLNLTNYTYAYPIGLPYGVLKKVELARTLMTNPKMIILDEPAAGLNDAETKELAAFIKKIRDEYDLTIFLVEHDMGLVMSICDTVCAISFGKKLAIGTPKEIQKSKVVQEAYLGGD